MFRPFHLHVDEAAEKQIGQRIVHRWMLREEAMCRPHAVEGMIKTVLEAVLDKTVADL